jgi:uncharacterized protein YabE (DUF348 family)
VAKLLEEKHIKLDNGESVNPVPSTPITSGIQIFILAKGSKVETVEQDVPFPVQKNNDFSLSFGTTVVHQQGVNGKQAITYLITAKKDGYQRPTPAAPTACARPCRAAKWPPPAPTGRPVRSPS